MVKSSIVVEQLNAVMIPIVPGDRLRVKEMIGRAIQGIDPKGESYPAYRKFVNQGVIPDEDLQAALDQIRALMMQIGLLRFVYEENQVLYEPLNIRLPYPDGNPRKGEIMGVRSFMLRHLALGAGRMVDRLWCLQTLAESNLKTAVG